MPKIGMRIIKSSCAVAICFLISLFRVDGIVFYSCIAAVLCIQQDVTNSKKVALNRVKGTLLGGFFGMLVLLIEKSFFPVDALWLRYIVISMMIIPIIYLTVLLKMTSASYISCVVFMSVTVSHGMDINPYLFTMNRIIDTLIGIFVALALNTIHLGTARNKDILFVSDLNHTLLNDDEELSAYTKVKLKQLLEQGANITIATCETPSTFLHKLQGISFQLPIITMNGAATFDMKKQEYDHCKEIPFEIYHELMSVFEKQHINCFVHAIIHHMLHVYYGDFQNPVEEDYYHAMRKTPYKTYVYSKLPEKHHAIYIHAIHDTQSIHALYDEIKKLPCFYDLHIVIRSDALHQGYSSMDIYSKDAGKKQAVEDLMRQYHFEKVYVFGDDIEDLPLMGSATQSFAVKNAKKEILAHAQVIASNNEDGVVQKISQIFYKKLKG